MTDYKDWIQNRAEEIANEEHNSEFYDLSEEIQSIVYNRAMEAHKDHMADQIDRAADAEKYGRLGL